jgi:hypothetical protein
MLGLALDYRSNEAKAPSSPLSITTSGPDTDYPFFGDIRDQLNVTPATIQPKSWLYGVRLDATRELRRDLTGYAGISYSVAGEFGGQDRIIRLTCKLAKTLDSYLTASYLQRESSGEIVANVPMSDFTTIIGIRRTFGP